MSKAFYYVQRGDIALFYIINSRLKCRFFDVTMPIITHLGSALFTIGFAIMTLILGRSSKMNFGWNISISLAFSHVLIHFLKRIANRPRPNITLSNVNTFSISLYDQSFPSGHTTAAFSVAASIAFIFPEIGLFAIIMAGLVGMSRVYLGVHYPTDVLIGALIGIVSAFYIHQLMIKSSNLICSFIS